MPKQAGPPLTLRALLLSLSALTVITGAAMSANLPGIRAAFGSDPRAVWLTPMVLTLPALGIALFAWAFGWSADRFGRKPTLLLALVLYASAGMSGLLVQSLPQLVLTRLVQGFGAGGIMTCATALVADAFAGQDRARFLGWQSASTGLGGALFLLIGGALADLNWRAPFWVYGAGFVAAGLVLWLVREPPRAQVAATLDHAWPAGGKRAVATAYAVGLAFMVVFYLLPVKLPFMLREELAAPGVAIGGALALSTVVTAGIAFRYGWIRARLGFRAIASWFGLLVGAGCWVLALVPTWPGVLGGVVLVGAGLGPVFPNGSAWVSAMTPPAFRARALGGLTTCLFLGQFLSPIAFQGVASRWGLGGPLGVYAWAGGLALAVSGLLALRRSP